MIIEFPKYVEYKFFYRFLLEEMMSFINEPLDGSNELIINLRNTDYVSPNVICDLLCYLKYLHAKKEAEVKLIFGGSKRLISYLDDAWFFLHSDNGKLFQTDVLIWESKNKSLSKAYNTNKVNRVDIPKWNNNSEREKKLPIIVIGQIQRQIHSLFSGDKANGMLSLGLSNPDQLATAFAEIVGNSYEHSNDFYNSGCYYTFQNYKKTGLNFACSDIGIGFYESLKRQFIYQDDHKDPKVFSMEEFLGFESDKKKKNLAAIIESIVLRIQKDCLVEFGFPFIFRTLVLPCNGCLLIHSGNTLLKIDTEFLFEFCLVKDGEVVSYFREKMRSIVMNREKQRELINKGSLRYFGYSFPGVHLSVQIEGGRTDVQRV